MHPGKSAGAMAALLAACAAAGEPAPDDLRIEARQVATFGQGEFLESVIEDGGTLYVTSLQSGRIYRVDRSGRIEPWVTLPAGREGSMSEGIFCLAADGNGGVYANLYSPDPSIHGVWHVNGAGAAGRVATLPPQIIPNGLARHASGDLYIADSAAGGIWKVDHGAGRARLWADSPLLRPRQSGRQYPAVNGLQIRGDILYATVSDTLRVVRLAILGDGSAGPVELIAEGVGGDDFAIDADGSLYITTHPFNSIVSISPDGSSRTVAGIEQGVVGPTAATIVRGADGTRTLYVVTDGGLYAPPPEGPGPARLLALRLPD